MTHSFGKHGFRTRRAVAAALTLVGSSLAVLAGPAAPAAAAAVSIDLWAVTGSTTLPGGQSVPVLGYRLTDGTVTRPGGPVLEVTEGDTVDVTLHNQTGERSALLLQGQSLPADLDGVAAGGTVTYSFTADHAGTYLYEAGLAPNTEHQVAMGLYGALVVRPATANQAYAAASTAYDTEAVLVLGELDPALNTAANPAAFDMRKFAPRYFLVNGRAHPDTDPIAAAADSTVLLRYVNAGMLYHSMGVMGAGQRVIALDGSPFAQARHYTAETVGPGQTADSLVTTPAAAQSAQQLSVYDASLLLHNSNTGIAGGIFAAIDVPDNGNTDDTTGPVTRAVAHDGTDLTATVDDSTRGGSQVTAAEFYVDDVSGAPTAMDAVDGFDSAQESVTANVPVGSGDHVIYVRGQDAQGTWGPFSSVLVSGSDVGGPTTLAPSLAPSLTNHASTGVDVSATGDDSSSGNSNIKAAEYFVDGDTAGADGSGEPMTVNASAPVASLDATIPAAVVNGLGEGTHVIWIHAQDAQDNWGEAITIFLTVDISGPEIPSGSVLVDPSPNNGTLPISSTTAAVRVSAPVMTDPISGSVNSPVNRAEAFIDTVGANGTGFPLTASDGQFNDTTEGGYADIPLTTVRALANGSHTIYVHARDDAGNWGATTTGTLVVDKTVPTISGLAVSPSPTQGAAALSVTANANDGASAVVAAEWFRGTDPGKGKGTALPVTGTGPWTVSGTIDVRAWTEGSQSVRVRVRDAAGNWSATQTATVTVTAPLFFSTEGNVNPTGLAGTADDADIYSWTGSANQRAIDVSAAPYSFPANANVDGFDRVDATHFFLSFADTTTSVPGLGTVQDEDVVYYDAGTWSVWFDGTAHGLTNANHDLDAISVVGTTLYFSTRGATNPPGIGGPADDADIFRWNGTSYAKAWDATNSGFGAGANVDGLVWLDATHRYLSFSGTTTAVPGLGNAADEDVVYAAGATWAMHFDGSTHGLGASDGQDVDAFDLP